jgi:cell wall-associated NlpC family hydrolase
MMGPMLVGAGALALGALALWRASQRATGADEPPTVLPGAASAGGSGAGSASAAPGIFSVKAGPSASAYLFADGELEGTVNRFGQTAMAQPYSWGAGGPGAPWPLGSAGDGGGRGWDCSGLVGAAWAGLLLMPWSAPRFWTGSVEALCDAVALGDQRPGDAVLYDGHIVLVLTWPDSAGDSLVLSASNGGRDTNGDDPEATVKVWSSWRYRADAKTALRPKASLASGISEGQREACLSLHALLAGQGLPAGSALAPGRRDELLRQFYGQLDVVQAALGGAA